MRIRIAALAAITAATLLLAGGPSASLGSTAAYCSASNLRLELVRTQGAAGSRIWDLALRNVAPQACRLHGFPGVGLLDGNAQLMNVHVGRHGGVRTVVMRAWQRSFFTFHFVSNGPCSHGVFPTGLQVTPPNLTQGLRIFSPFGMCKGSTPTVTTVRAKLNG